MTFGLTTRKFTCPAKGRVEGYQPAGEPSPCNGRSSATNLVATYTEVPARTAAAGLGVGSRAFHVAGHTRGKHHSCRRNRLHGDNCDIRRRGAGPRAGDGVEHHAEHCEFD